MANGHITRVRGMWQWSMDMRRCRPGDSRTKDLYRPPNTPKVPTLHPTLSRQDSYPLWGISLLYTLVGIFQGYTLMRIVDLCVSCIGQLTCELFIILICLAISFHLFDLL